MTRAVFHPQAWQNDYAVPVDPQGPTEWTITPTVLAELRDRHGDLDADTYASDELRYDDAAPDWIREWSGPFWIETTE